MVVAAGQYLKTRFLSSGNAQRRFIFQPDQHEESPPQQ
jgi:hypothetical protein